MATPITPLNIMLARRHAAFSEGEPGSDVLGSFLEGLPEEPRFDEGYAIHSMWNQISLLQQEICDMEAGVAEKQDVLDIEKRSLERRYKLLDELVAGLRKLRT